MRIAHVGPYVSRGGGPAGVLNQLRSAMAEASDEHELVFPPPANSNNNGKPRRHTSPTLFQKLRRWKYTYLGRPAYYRPVDSELVKKGGCLSQHFASAHSSYTSSVQDVMDAMSAETADVLFAFDTLTAKMILQQRRPSQQVWLMNLCPMPSALYDAWNWAVPERDWREVYQWPDVQSAAAEELEVWKRVDRLIHPSPEAQEEIERIDARFAQFADKTTILPYSAHLPALDDVESLRVGDSAKMRWKLPNNTRVGLYLGNDQPYRGFDALVTALEYLPHQSALPGVIAVAGPATEFVPCHPRLLPLGHVADVATLLRAVDFVINVNRFCLYDLATIEAAQAAKPMLLHHVGGNKSFAALGIGCNTMPDLEPRTIARGLRGMFEMTATELDRLSRDSRACYDQNFTQASLRNRFLAFYDEVAKGTMGITKDAAA